MKLIIKYILFITVLQFIVSCASGNNSSSFQLAKNYLKESHFAVIDTNEIKSIAREFVVSGSKYQQTGDHNAAIVEFMEALEYDSSNSINFLIGKSYFELGKYPKAKKIFTSVIKKDSSFYVAYDFLARIFLLEGNIENAIEIYNDLSKMSNYDEHFNTLAELYEFHNPDKAIEIYESIYQKRNDKNALIKLINLYSTTENDLKYKETIEKLSALYPSNPEYTYRLSQIYIEKNEIQNLINLVKEFDANAAFEDRTVMYQFLCQSIYDKVPTDLTIINPVYNLIKDHFHFDEYLVLLMGYFYDLMNTNNENNPHFERLLKITVDSSKAINSIAGHFFNKRNYNEVIKYLKMLPNNNWENNYYLGLAHHNNGDTATAINYYLKSIEYDANKPESWTNLGALYSSYKDFEKSDSAYQKALDLSPDDALINNNFAYNLAEQGKNLLKAKQMSLFALEKEPDNASYLDTYAWVMYKMGNYEEALKYINKAAENTEESAELLEHLGDILIMLNRKESAIDAWKRAMELDLSRSYMIDRFNIHR